MVGLFLDLSQAFDTLEHSLVLSKMERYGIRGVNLDQFSSYLSNRTIRVKCKTVAAGCETKSDLYSVEYGMPQGLCLGPLIFLLFVNNLHLYSCLLVSNLQTIPL